MENFYVNHLWVDNEGKTLRRECSRSRGVDSCKRRVDIIDFQGVLLAITTPFFVYSKKNLQTENSVTVLQSSVMFAQSYILSIAKSKKQIFSLSSKKETSLVQNFNLIHHLKIPIICLAKFNPSPFLS